MSQPQWVAVTPHQQLTALLAAAQRIAGQMVKTGGLNEKMSSVAEFIDGAASELAGVYAVSSEQRAENARESAQEWRRIEALENRSAA